MLAKETGVTVLLLNLAIDLYRCWPVIKRSICSLKIEKKCSGLSIRSLKVVVSLLLLLSIRLGLLQGTWPVFSPQDNPAAFHSTFFVRLMTFCYLAAFNWWLLLCPWTLSHDWQMGSVPLITSGWDPRNLVTFAAFGALLLLADIASLPQNAKLHYNLGNFLRETDQHDDAVKHYKEALRLWPTYASAHNNMGTLVVGTHTAEHHFLLAIMYNKHHMLERCIWLQPRFVQAHVELLTLKPDAEKIGILRRLLELEPTNWEHYILYGNWLKDKGLPGASAKYFAEATRLSFRIKISERSVRSDLVSLRSTALVYRALGQKSRILQLLTRWHTWRRGRPSPAAHIYLRDWSLKIELEGRAQAYSRAVNPAPPKSTCFDHNQLVVETKKDNPSAAKNQASKHQSAKTSSVCKTCVKKRNLSVSTQIKTTHNKSEIGLKHKKCTPHAKDKNNNNIISKLNTPMAEHILMKTF
ncbi:unnamed protein product [Leptidea sinapis]|uniref:dolichyl-phosphate-mannose--protein mannosyltransferase n=1 Tax=Leptidea sinapis TaxID=189913 RepID=A0A5E4PME1_9NEOP|nr:unnamed protein product [Leptidea sinapis]